MAESAFEGKILVGLPSTSGKVVSTEESKSGVRFEARGEEISPRSKGLPSKPHSLRARNSGISESIADAHRVAVTALQWSRKTAGLIIDVLCEESIPGIIFAIVFTWVAQQSELFAAAGSQQSPRTEAKEGSANASSTNQATPERIFCPNQPPRDKYSDSIKSSLGPGRHSIIT